VESLIRLSQVYDDDRLRLLEHGHRGV